MQTCATIRSTRSRLKSVFFNKVNYTLHFTAWRKVCYSLWYRLSNTPSWGDKEDRPFNAHILHMF